MDILFSVRLPALRSVITEPAMERMGLRKHKGPETLATVLSIPDELAKSINIQSRWGQKMDRFYATCRSVS